MSGNEVTRGGLRDWIAIFLMLSSAPVLGLMFSAMTPALLLIATHFGASGPILSIPWLGVVIDGPFFAQMVSALPSFGLMLAGPAIGWAIDRFGVRVVLVWSLVAFALFGSAGMYVESPLLLLVSRFALGFAAAGYGAATVSMIGIRFNDRQRARALSYRNLLAGLSGFVLVKAAGYAAARFGWHGSFGLYLAALPIVPLVLFAVPPIPSQAIRQANGDPTPSLRPLWPIFGVVAMLAVVMMMNATQLPFLLADNGITDPKAIAHIGAITSLAIMGGTLTYAAVGPHLGPRQNYSLIALALGLGVAITGTSHGAVIATVGASLTSFGSGLMIPHFGRLVLGAAPPAARGRAVGLNYTFTYLGDFLNPVAVHPLALAIGIHQAFQLIGATVAATALQIIVPFRLGRERPTTVSSPT